VIDLADRLARVPGWRLWFFLIFPVAFCAAFFVGEVRAGAAGWATVFGVLLALSAGVWLAGMLLKLRGRRGRQPSN